MVSGGKRKGSGRKSKYGEPSIRVTFRIPVSKYYEIKQIINNILKRYEVSSTTQQKSQ